MTFPARPDKGTTDGGEGRDNESNGCTVPLAIAARDNKVDDVVTDPAKPKAGEATRDGEANTADRGSSLQSGNGWAKDEDDGCRGMLVVVAEGSRLVLTGPPWRGAFIREELGQVG